MKRTLTLVVIVGLVSASSLFAQSDVASRIKSMEDNWEANIAKKAEGTKVVGDYLADDFSGVSSKGKRHGKAGALSEMRKDTDTYTSTKNSNLKVTVYSSNVAVAIGDSQEKGKGKDGASFDRVYRFTDTWVQRKGKWQCVASQVTLVRGSMPK